MSSGEVAVVRLGGRRKPRSRTGGSPRRGNGRRTPTGRPLRTLTAPAGAGAGVALPAAKRSVLTAMIGAAAVTALRRLAFG